MKFTIITHAVHKKKEQKYFAYEPYVREMNLWLTNFSEIKIIAPLSTEDIKPIETSYISNNIVLSIISSFNLLSLKNKLETILKIPIVLFKIYNAMRWADHIHLRCPGNVGLLGCLVQCFFPSKPKTVKYAGNWDPKSTIQPLSYRIQRKILSNTFLTKNCKVLVYGEWENQTKNIVPFFTASYNQNEIEKISDKNLQEEINLIFVGTFSKGKQPLKSVQVTEKLYKKGYNVKLNMFGNGSEFETVKEYINDNKLNSIVILHGNQPKEIVKKAFQKSHFLVFISKSEGWPKVVAEAMFWSCLPVSTKVSCVPYMLGSGSRGALIDDNVDNITKTIVNYINDEKKFLTSIEKAKQWSQQYTLEKFEKEIKKLL